MSKLIKWCFNYIKEDVTRSHRFIENSHKRKECCCLIEWEIKNHQLILTLALISSSSHPLSASDFKIRRRDFLNPGVSKFDAFIEQFVWHVWLGQEVLQSDSECMRVLFLIQRDMWVLSSLEHTEILWKSVLWLLRGFFWPNFKNGQQRVFHLFFPAIAVCSLSSKFLRRSFNFLFLLSMKWFIYEEVLLG